MRRALFIWAACSIVGVGVLALPDAGPRLVAFSEAHGLTLLDTAGVAMLLGGWVPVLRRASAGRQAAGGAAWAPRSRWPAFVAGLGLGLLIASVFSDFAGWWAVGAGLLVAVQLVVLTGVAARRSD